MKRKLFLILLFFSTSVNLNADIINNSLPDGTYNETQYVKLASPQNTVDFYFYFQESNDKVPVKYSIPLELSSLQGEDRTYTLHVDAVKRGAVFSKNAVIESKTFTYRINRKAPERPDISLPSGVYAGDTSVGFQYPGGTRLYYSLGSLSSRIQWDGKPVVLHAPESGEREYTLSAYIVDSLGNKSKTVSEHYIIVQTIENGKKYLNIQSPVEGVFANQQLLAVEQSGYSWIRYTVDGKNPATDGVLYRQPILLKSNGQIHLRIAAGIDGIDTITEKSIDYEVSAGGSEILSEPSGVYTEDILLNPPSSGDYQLNLQDEDPKPWSPEFSEPLHVKTIKNTKITVVLRLKKENSGIASPVFRYCYVLDPRIPEQPSCFVLPLKTEKPSFKIMLAGPPHAEIYYTINGDDPDRDHAFRFTSPFIVDRTDADDSGRCTIRARAYYQNGISSTETMKRFSFNSVPPQQPVVDRKDSSSLVMKPVQGMKIVYEISRTKDELQFPGVSSQEIEPDIEYRVPYGFESTMYMRFASIDEAGNVSESTKIYPLHADRHPPAPPVIHIDSGKVTINGQEGSRTFYSIADETESYTVPGINSPEYHQPFSISGEEDALSRYKIAAVSVDDTDNFSTVPSVKTFYIDNRKLNPPDFYGVSDGGVYNHPVTVEFTKQYSDIDILYTFTDDGSEPSDPSSGAASAEDSKIVIQGQDGKRIQYRMKLSAVYRISGRKSSIASLSFIIDKEPPKIPELTGFIEGGSYSKPVTVSLKNKEEGVSYYLGIGSNQNPPECFGKNTIVISDSVTVDTQNGTERAVRLEIGAIDQAGNQAVSSKQYSFTIDKKPPTPPIPLGIPDLPTNRTVSLSYSAGDSVLYSVSEGQNLPVISTPDLTKYEKPLLFHGRADDEVFYHLQAVCADKAGNFSIPSRIYSFIIDRRPPDQPEDPLVSLSNQSVFDISWPKAEKNCPLYYSFFEEDGTQLTEYTRYVPGTTIARKLPSAASIGYYATDEAGNKSKVRYSSLRGLGKILEVKPIFNGADQNGKYNQAVTIHTPVQNVLVRYETSEGNIPPEPVNQYSPVFRSLTFDVLPGETKIFTIRGRIFHDSSYDGYIRDQDLTFTIDKTPPAPPVFSGIGDGQYYQDDVKVNLSSSEGSIYYKIERYNEEENAKNVFDYKRYDGEIPLTAETGQLLRYTVSAYTVDDAGNKNAKDIKESIVIDKKNIFVSGNGNDLYSGSKGRPFRTIDHALNFAEKTGRNSLIVAEGVYDINAAITSSGELIIKGGYNPETWDRSSSGRTVLRPGKYFDHTGPLLKISSGAFTGDGLVFSTNSPYAESRAQQNALIQINGGHTAIMNSVIETGSAQTLSAVVQDGGSSNFFGTEFSIAGTVESCLSAENSDEIILQNCSFEKQAAPQYDAKLVKLENCQKVGLSFSMLSPSDGKNTVSLYADSSKIDTKNCFFDSGAGYQSAAAVYLNKSTLRDTGGTFTGSGKARISYCMQVSGSELELIRTTVNVDAVTGGTGVYARDSRISIQKSSFESYSPRDFLYFIQLRHSSLKSFNNLLNAAVPSDFTAFELFDSEASIFNNTMIFQLQTDNSFCIRSRGTSSIRVINNIIDQNGKARKGTVFSLEKPKAQIIASNNLYGWSQLLESPPVRIGTVSQLNLFDNSPLGGDYRNNIAEPPIQTFITVKTAKEYKLQQSSDCVNGGEDVTVFGGPAEDIDGDSRPNMNNGLKPAFDIGADEFY